MPIVKRCLMVEVGNVQLSVVKQCKLLSLQRSRFYYDAMPESAENLNIMRWLDEQYFDTPFYGSLRLTALLVSAGYMVNIKKVRRLMKLVGGTLFTNNRVQPMLTRHPTSILIY